MSRNPPTPAQQAHSFGLLVNDVSESSSDEEKRMEDDSGCLSKEEFLALQEQLLALRQENYELQDALKKSRAEISASVQSPKNEALQFASKLINRGKDKESQRYEVELNAMRSKMATQEEEFKLQQDTMSTEMRSLVSHNEQLELEITKMKENSPEEFRLKEEKLFSERDALEKEVSATKKSADECRLALESAQLDIKKLSDELNQKKAKLKEQASFERALEDQLLGYKEKLNSLSSTKENVSKELGSSIQRINILETEKANLEVSVKDLQTELEKTSELHKTSLEELDRLRNYLEKSQSETNDLKLKIVSLEQQSSELNAMEQSNREMLEQSNNDKEIMEKRLAELANEMQCLQQQLASADQLRLSNDAQYKEKLQKAEEEMVSMKDNHEHNIKDELVKWKNREEQYLSEIQTLRKRDAKDLDDRALLLETRYQLELADREKAVESEKKALILRISHLEESLAGKDEEKNLALKKQSSLIKELQRALKEEKKRVDSYDKGRDREGWHVVDSDQRSNHTFDGNESVSSVSALESDNAELINRLSSMHKVNSDSSEKIMVLQNENSKLQKEIAEKNELIEHWIRNRPNTGPQSSIPQRQEGVFRKLLSSTLPGSESHNDMMEMNKKLQRMLEETLSKNIILQRDLQTLLERTEM